MFKWARRRFHALYTLGRLLGWNLGDRSPFVATLKVTTRCALNCRHCPWTLNQVEDLPSSRWMEIIAALARRGVVHIVLEGGEPTMRNDLEELVLCGKRYGMRTTIATNGTRSLEDYSPDRFLVSIDGLEDVHDWLRGDGAFERLLEYLPTARAPRVALVSLCRKNHHQIREILDFFSGRVEGFWFSFVYDYDGVEPLALTREEMQAAAQEVLSLMSRYPIVNTSSFLRRVGILRKCRPWLLTTVTANGIEQPGCMVDALGTCRCNECELPCHREISDFVEPRFMLDHFMTYLKKPWLRPGNWRQ
jgi:MoaA/NifB/PqqE/SkfB family radical SAM enzyme